MNCAIISIAAPIKISATATIQTKIRGSMITATPRTMRIIPGSMNIVPEPGFSIMPLHVSAIGHIGIGVDSAMGNVLKRLR
jgi:hypothetical protein